MEMSVDEGLHCSAWEHRGQPGGEAGAGRQRRALGRLLHGDPDGSRPPVPGHHDQRGGADPAAATGDRASGGCRKSCRATTTRASSRRRHKRGVTIGMGMTEKQGGTDVRANTTHGRAGRQRRPGRGISHHRAQVVHVGADVRRVPGAGAGAGRPVLLPDAALPAGRHRQRAALPAPQGQARQSLQCLLGGRVPGGACVADRRGRARRSGHHRDGDGDAARLRGRLGRSDAAGARQCHPSLPPPHRVSEAARRSAADAAGAGRPGARRGSGHGAGVPPRAQLRPRLRSRTRRPGAG